MFAWTIVGMCDCTNDWIALQGKKNGRCVMVTVQTCPLTENVPATVPMGVPTEKLPPAGPPEIVPPFWWMSDAILINRSCAPPVKGTLNGLHEAIEFLPINE
ncbi:hypothetical protein [Paracidovorax valerianellae]|uniref:hypothetical protein n=1 Tax=Paracidovorax valerianellae TaxID=187868 RepID=UPI0015872EDE|nr:hypothetical protein [Paracidovorax valerianellae]MDA8447290.1 hypothetical protein [Paracidovorax valerianellae]